MAEEQKVYMPLMIGDWLKGTRGMKAEVRGVYINLLLYQWDNGHLPSDWEELCLIDPELPKVWDKLKGKFPEIGPGKLQNKKNKEVRDFWAKQRSNGSKGGRPKKKTQNETQPETQTQTQTQTFNNDLDIDHDFKYELKDKKGVDAHTVTVEVPRGTVSQSEMTDEWFSSIFDEKYMEGLIFPYRGIDLRAELEKFKVKVRGDPNEYGKRDTGGIRNAFLFQLNQVRPGGAPKTISADRMQQFKNMKA
jgi:uncharacterized protein YdaU (DUF1376 family)